LVILSHNCMVFILPAQGSGRCHTIFVENATRGFAADVQSYVALPTWPA
jgi:hypothetical protein